MLVLCAGGCFRVAVVACRWLVLAGRWRVSLLVAVAGVLTGVGRLFAYCSVCVGGCGCCLLLGVRCRVTFCVVVGGRGRLPWVVVHCCMWPLVMLSADAHGVAPFVLECCCCRGCCC